MQENGWIQGDFASLGLHNCGKIWYMPVARIQFHQVVIR